MGGQQVPFGFAQGRLFAWAEALSRDDTIDEMGSERPTLSPTDGEKGGAPSWAPGALSPGTEPSVGMTLVIMVTL